VDYAWVLFKKEGKESAKEKKTPYGEKGMQIQTRRLSKVRKVAKLAGSVSPEKKRRREKPLKFWGGKGGGGTRARY